MLLTFEGLRRFTKEHLGEIGTETPSGIINDIKLGLASGVMQPLESQLAAARKLGLKLYACPNAMAALNIALYDLREEVDSIMGLASFLELARSAAVNWYI